MTRRVLSRGAESSSPGRPLGRSGGAVGLATPGHGGQLVSPPSVSLTCPVLGLSLPPQLGARCSRTYRPPSRGSGPSGPTKPRSAFRSCLTPTRICIQVRASPETVSKLGTRCFLRLDLPLRRPRGLALPSAAPQASPTPCVCCPSPPRAPGVTPACLPCARPPPQPHHCLPPLTRWPCPPIGRPCDSLSLWGKNKPSLCACEEPDSKHFRLCGPYRHCRNHSTLPL